MVRNFFVTYVHSRYLVRTSVKFIHIDYIAKYDYFWHNCVLHLNGIISPRKAIYSILKTMTR